MASQSVQIEPLKSQIQNLDINDQKKVESEQEAQINMVTQDPETVSDLSIPFINQLAYSIGSQRDLDEKWPRSAIRKCFRTGKSCSGCKYEKSP